MNEMLQEALSGKRGPDQQRIAQTGTAWIETIIAKNTDYGSSVFEVPVLAPECDAGAAIRVRMSDKINRVKTLLKNVALVKSESIEDSIGDLGAYCLLWLARPQATPPASGSDPAEWHSETEVDLDAAATEAPANKSEHYKRVEKFMQMARQETPELAKIPSEDVRRLRAKLIIEEAIETVNALGFSVETHAGKCEFVADRTPNLIEIIDGCCDVRVVTTGTLIACGVPDLPFQNAVDENNLAKFGPGHSWREDGKLIKPEGHKPPDIIGILGTLLLT